MWPLLQPRNRLSAAFRLRSRACVRSILMIAVAFLQTRDDGKVFAAMLREGRGVVACASGVSGVKRPDAWQQRGRACPLDWS